MSTDANMILALASMVTAVGGIMLTLTTRRKVQADAAGAVTDAAVTLLKPLEDRVKELELRLKDARRTIEELENIVQRQERLLSDFRRAIRVLYGQLVALGVEPKYTPCEGDADEADRA